MAGVSKMMERMSGERFLYLLYSLSNGTVSPDLSILLTNYKLYEEEYSRNPVLFSSVVYTTARLKLEDTDLWTKLESKLPQHINAISIPKLVSLAPLLKQRNSPSFPMLEKALEIKLSAMPSVFQAKLCQTLPDSPVLSKIPTLPMVILREPDLVFCAKVFLSRKNQLPEVCAALETGFYRLLPWIKSLNTLGYMLEKLNEAGHQVELSTLQAVTATVLRNEFPLYLQPVEQFLSSLNRRLNFGRIPPFFWEGFGRSILKQIKEFQPGLTMIGLSRKKFFVESVFSELILKWKNRTESLDISNFNDGLIGILASPFCDEAILRWAKPYCIAHASKLRDADRIAILQGFATVERYDFELWDKLLSCISFPALSSIDKSALFRTFKTMEIDSPKSVSASLLGKYRELYEKLGSFPGARTDLQSMEKGQKGRLDKYLLKLGLGFERYYQVDGIYVADYYIKQQNTLVLNLWTDYVSQVDGSVILSFQLKLRHFQKRGYHVIAVFSMKNVGERIQKALKLAQVASRPVIISVRSSLVTNVGAEKPFLRLVTEDQIV